MWQYIQPMQGNGFFSSWGIQRTDVSPHRSCVHGRDAKGGLRDDPFSRDKEEVAIQRIIFIYQPALSRKRGGQKYDGGMMRVGG